MSYGNDYTNKPFEKSSKTAHTNIVNDDAVKSFLSKCKIQPFYDEVDSKDFFVSMFSPKTSNPITTIIAIDGGYSDVCVREEYPSATIAFLQLGVLFFKNQDLIDLKEKPFIDPKDFSKLQNIEKLKLVIPTKGVIADGENDLISSVRKAIYDFFVSQELMPALEWLIFEEYNDTSNVPAWQLSHCPHCNNRVYLKRSDVSKDYTITCPHCGEQIYLTDILRLHEIIDNELGASGILGYLITSIEQIIIVHLIQQMLVISPDLLRHTLFVKDGPLAFFGQTANLHTPMQKLIRYLNQKNAIYLVGLEKSGSFVEHAAQISPKLLQNQILILGNDYIYKYIIPGHAKNNEPYGSSSYYGNKLIFKSVYDDVYVATLPSAEMKLEPQAEDYINMDIILQNITELKCDLYYSSLVPVVLANKLVSLADHPSADILKSFAQDSLSQ